MFRTIHPVASALALLTVCTFWLSTAYSELTGDLDLIVRVKTWIPWGFIVLIPAVIAAGGSGAVLGRRMRGALMDAKRRRMPIVAANGLFVLVPSAIFLAVRAQAGDLDGVFYAVQAIELAAGAVNILLLGLNMRDGIRLAARRRLSARPL
jgi:Na+/H+ antiporter NhaA